ncbi:MAG: tRNA glutamyl-Q(34) synthetase GluQRS [Pseudomonadota bacterium]
MTFRTRFAPSPTGPLHLGHAFSAMLAHDMALAEGGEFLLRIEDIDRSRARPEWEEMIYDDLQWLGLSWEEPALRQSERMTAYDKALNHIWQMGILYPCKCTRRDIQNALAAPQEGAELPRGPDGPVYPGTCRENMAFERKFPDTHPRPKSETLRLDMTMSVMHDRVFDRRIDAPEGGWHWYAGFTETGHCSNGETDRIEFTPEDMTSSVGDIVLARRDMGTSYHLSVVVDDAAQDITHVVRGEDLFEATRIHVLLQQLLHLPTPIYRHHKLIRDDAGKRLAKRDDARAIRTYREDGASPADVRRMVGL